LTQEKNSGGVGGDTAKERRRSRRVDSLGHIRDLTLLGSDREHPPRGNGKKLRGISKKYRSSKLRKNRK